MTRLQSIEEIRNLTADVRNMRKGFITNFYLDEFKHHIWIQKGDFFYDIVGETLFLIKNSASFSNLFYNTTSVEALGNDLKELKSKYPEMVAMVDIVGRDSQCQPLVEALKSQGYAEAATLVRMTRMTTEPMDYQPDESISSATTDEVNEIYAMLHHFFDEKTEQIPYIEELLEYAGAGHILVCHENNQLAGFVVFGINATTLYLRYWFTHPDFRDRKIGSRLLRRFFEEGKETKRQLFWVIRTNGNAIKRYRHYGFTEDNMFDYVMRTN